MQFIRFPTSPVAGRCARAGITEAWLLDLITEHVEVFREPSGGRYREIIRLGRGAGLAPHAFPDLALVDDLLG
jgi:Uma2 family endonuclease